MENNEWYTEAIKEGIRRAEEKREEEPKKKSGRYPWGNITATKTYTGWVNEILANKDALYSVEEIHPAIDLILKANIADELHRLNDILSRRKQ